MKTIKQSLIILLLFPTCFLLSCKKEFNAPEKTNKTTIKSTVELPTKIIAHRGSSITAPENTLASAKLAWEQDADILECDVWLSKDKKVIVSHDETTNRTTNGNYSIPLTDSKVLRSLDAGSWKGDSFRGEKLPFLEELLATVPENKGIFIELKSGENMKATELVPYVKEIVETSGKIDQVSIISFELDALQEVKKQIPNVNAIYVTYNYFLNIPYMLEKMKSYNLDGIDTYYFSTTKWLIDKFKENGFKTYVWTLDEPKIAKKLMGYGIDGITTNRPGFLKSKLSE
ncbi:MAG: glycerophosphodiester phosphodiesterase [Bacteroidales bacterium]